MQIVPDPNDKTSSNTSSSRKPACGDSGSGASSSRKALIWVVLGVITLSAAGGFYYQHRQLTETQAQLGALQSALGDSSDTDAENVITRMHAQSKKLEQQASATAQLEQDVEALGAQHKQFASASNVAAAEEHARSERARLEKQNEAQSARIDQYTQTLTTLKHQQGAMVAADTSQRERLERLQDRQKQQSESFNELKADVKRQSGLSKQLEGLERRLNELEKGQKAPDELAQLQKDLAQQKKAMAQLSNQLDAQSSDITALRAANEGPNNEGPNTDLDAIETRLDRLDDSRRQLSGRVAQLITEVNRLQQNN
ncbi:hypothetical protein [Larsenimonas suaedae]|uniref:Chromosome partitioning protein ParA n=1 Tax=Larsenimonas suaedae TaxID=1851019 RepID=A0ABU1GVM6_9GAMM|nr:hypothetical protein [Larsenimonas suaedae]MCM2971353.1 hypothetical protein [Larsenimonas suaedae]MDR5896064.1 hypothetical protein [Larsenimonas suaedae]